MYDVCVVGLGYVGLPTACVFATSGLNTIGVDVRKAVVTATNEGRSHLAEREVAKAIRRVVRKGTLSATPDIKGAVSSSKSVIIAVQTPFEEGAANLSHLLGACDSVAGSMNEGTLVITESSVPPSTCDDYVLPIFRSKGWIDGQNFFFAYCPERIAPGSSIREFTNNDRIVGSNVTSSLRKATSLLESVTKGKIYETDILTAETVKLVENTSRDVSIAFANDLARLCTKIGADVWEVIRLANTHPRVKILRPGPGVGGPCLTKDPYMLLQGASSLHSETGCLVREARRVNEEMPEVTVAMITKGLNSPPHLTTVTILGTAYKPEVGDPRASPSEPVIHSLLELGYKVLAFDPYCVETFGARSCNSLESALRGVNCVVFMVAHKSFLNIDVEKMVKIMAPQPLLVDVVGVLDGDGSKKGYTILKLGGRSAHKLDAKV